MEEKIYGLDYWELEHLSLDKIYHLIKANTNYLDDIELNEIKDIKISNIEKDVFILIKDGRLFKNGKTFLNDIKVLNNACNLIRLVAIGNDNSIHDLNAKDDAFLNDNNYQYKSIIITPDCIVALTKEKKLRIVGQLVGLIDYERMSNVEDIGYVIDEDANYDIVVIKGKKAISLLKDDTIYSKTDSRIVYNDNSY